MGQYFLLVNLDSPVKVKNCVGGKFGEFFFYSGQCDNYLLEALWNPGEAEKVVEVLPVAEVEDYNFPTPRDVQSMSNGPLGQLSTELISKILEEVQDISDLVTMMMTCQRLWDIGRSVLAGFIQNLFTISWAGDRLVVFGDYANIEDLPAGMLNKSEMKWIEDSKLSQEHLWEIIEELQIHNQHRNFNAAQSNLSFQYQLCYGEGVFASSWIGQRRWHGSQIRKLLAALASLVRFRDRRVRKNFFDGRAVFRNLNTKEYICWTSVMSSEPQENELRVEDLSFEHVLYIRTVWSSDPSMAIADGTAVYRGVWAGHRFDVSRIESVQDENGASIDGWKDVSAEVVQEIAAIWE